MPWLYRYFVSAQGVRCFGSGTYDMHAPITKRAHLRAIEADLRQSSGDPTMLVVSYRFLGRVRVPPPPTQSTPSPNPTRR
jgi:hypothetical protein